MPAYHDESDTDQVEICVISLECLCISLLPSVIDGIIFSNMCCFGCQDELLCTLSTETLHKFFFPHILNSLC